MIFGRYLKYLLKLIVMRLYHPALWRPCSSILWSKRRAFLRGT